MHPEPRTPTKALRQLPAKPAKKLEPKPPRAPGWWVAFADPSLPRENFFDAARDRNTEMRLNPAWQQSAKLGQIGQM